MRHLVESRSIRRIHNRIERVPHAQRIGSIIVAQAGIQGKMRRNFPLVVEVRRYGDFAEIARTVSVPRRYTDKPGRNPPQKLVKIKEAVPPRRPEGDICIRLDSVDGSAELDSMGTPNPG